MTNLITVLAPIKLAAGITEAELMAASERFQKEFVVQQPGVIRREMMRKGNGHYLDIIQFRSMEDVEDIMEKEKSSVVCHDFFAVMDMAAEAETGPVEFYQSLVTYD